MPLRPSLGFTLVEVLIAGSLLVGLAMPVTMTVVLAQRGAAAARRAEAARLAAAASLERFRALPFLLAAAAEPDGSSQPGDQGLVGEVFPHAVVERNNELAFYAPEARDGCAAGTFFTAIPSGQAVVWVRATFVAAGAGGWRPLPAEAVTGFLAEAGGPPPSAALRVQIVCPWREPAGEHRVVLDTVLAPSAPAVAVSESP